MSTRLFGWRDIPALHRFRKDCIYLNSAWLLTRGRLSLPSAMISTLSPARDVFTSITIPEDRDRLPLIGQVMQLPASRLAQLTFLMPEKAIHSSTLTPLLEFLSAQLIEQGILRILADIDENAAAYESLRSAGYAVYCRQRVWQMKDIDSQNEKQPSWRMVEDQDILAVRSLYYNIVPPLVQQVEPFPSNHAIGMVYKANNEVMGYVEPNYGHSGIWLQPLIHPDLEDLPEVLSGLVRALPYRFSRPVFICVRSYQSWLEPILEDFGAEAGPRQAVMVKHLAITQRALRTLAVPSLEGGQAEISAPFAHSENRHS